MKRENGHLHAGLLHRVGADDVADSQGCCGRITRRTLLRAAAAWPVMTFMKNAGAQPKQTPPEIPVRVGILRFGGNPGNEPPTARVFTEAMRELRWVEGRNITYDRVYASGDEAHLRALATELAARAPALIHAQTNIEALAAASATRSIPVVFASVAEPVDAGLVRSLARPGGNVTGVANIGWELGGKRMQLLIEALPKISRVGVLINPKGLTSGRELKLISVAAGPRVKIFPAAANVPQDFESAFAALAAQRVEALLATHTLIFQSQRKRVLEFAAKRRIPVLGFRTEFADDGALLSYSALLSDQVRRSAHISDKVLKGAAPASIPVELPTRFELVINLKAAKALGIAIPQSLLLRADRVIE